MTFLPTNQKIKAQQAAAAAAVELVKPDMVVGLGTGDTASYAIRLLAQRRVAGITCIPTSIRSENLANELGLHVLRFDNFAAHFPNRSKPWIDVTIDGADEIDPELRLVKGKGGALLFEKIVAQNSKELIIVADTDKVVTVLGNTCPLPVEIVPFGAQCTLSKLQQQSSHAQLRKQDDKLYFTDGGNLLVDFSLLESPSCQRSSPEEVHQQLKLMLGVIETGFFLHEATYAFVGNSDGSVTKMTRSEVRSRSLNRFEMNSYTFIK